MMSQIQRRADGLMLRNSLSLPGAKKATKYRAPNVYHFLNSSQQQRHSFIKVSQPEVVLDKQPMFPSSMDLLWTNGNLFFKGVSSCYCQIKIRLGRRKRTRLRLLPLQQNPSVFTVFQHMLLSINAWKRIGQHVTAIILWIRKCMKCMSHMWGTNVASVAPFLFKAPWFLSLRYSCSCGLCVHNKQCFLFLPTRLKPAPVRHYTFPKKRKWLFYDFWGILEFRGGYWYCSHECQAVLHSQTRLGHSSQPGSQQS